MSRALFITFEGPDGSGKTTQARLLARALRERGTDVLETREPGGTAVGEQVRHVLLDPGDTPMTPLVMALLLSAARAQHVASVIEPALAAGRTVVCDRYADSTVAYQGNGMGLALDTIHHLTALATGGLIPDITVCVDIDPDTGLERASSRGALNRLDKETLEFHQRVRKGYLALIAQQPDRWIAIDGGGTPEAVHEAVMCAVMARIKALGDAA